MALATSDPVHLQLRGDDAIARWRPFVHWLLVIPHLIVLWALGYLLSVLTLIAFVTVLFTKAVPDGIFRTIVMVHRYQWRVATYFACLRESYPPFELTPAAVDPRTDPAQLTIDPPDPPDSLHRLLPLVKWLLIIPHLIVLLFLHVASLIAMLIGWVAVVVSGRYPLGIRDFIVGVYRWTVRVQAYSGFITDHYPPFSLEETAGGGARPMPATPYPAPS